MQPLRNTNRLLPVKKSILLARVCERGRVGVEVDAGGVRRTRKMCMSYIRSGGIIPIPHALTGLAGRQASASRSDPINQPPSGAFRQDIIIAGLATMNTADPRTARRRPAVGRPSPMPARRWAGGGPSTPVSGPTRATTNGHLIQFLSYLAFWRLL